MKEGVADNCGSLFQTSAVNNDMMKSHLCFSKVFWLKVRVSLQFLNIAHNAPRTLILLETKL